MTDGKKIYRRVLGLLRNNTPLFVGQGIIITLFFLIFVPLVSYILRLMLNISGFSYVTPYNLSGFLLNPMNIALILLLFLMASWFLLFDVNFLVAGLSQKFMKQKALLLRLIIDSAYRAFKSIVKGNVGLIITLWVTLLVYNLPVIFFAVRKIRILRFVASVVPGNIFWFAVAFIVVGAIILKLYRMMFVFNYYAAAQNSCANAVKRGREYKNHRPWRTLVYYIGWNAVVISVLLLLYVIALAFTMLFVTLLFDKGIAVAAFISVSEIVERYFLLAMFVVSTIGSFALSTQLFFEYNLVTYENRKEGNSDIMHWEQKASFRRTLFAVLLVVVGLFAYPVISVLRNGSAINAVSLFDIQITAHRGVPEIAPENTISTIERAIEELADYVEVDVRVTRDGELVLLHDGSLRRTTGVDKFIWQVDYADIEQLDAGSWLNEGYSHLGIPKLREVFEICKGRINLNLDIKYRNAEEGLEEKVVSLIREYEMPLQCVVTSTSLACLEKIKELDAEVYTGYIVHRFSPGMLDNNAVDFFSINSTMVNYDVVRMIHQRGKLIHVWTVNTEKELQRISRIGADNVITDNPAYAREVLYLLEPEKHLVELFKFIWG